MTPLDNVLLFNERLSNGVDPIKDLCFNKLDKMAISAGIGLSTAKDHIQAVKEAISQARINIHTAKIDLAIVFSSIEFAHSSVLKTINSLLGEVPLVGCSSLAVISHQGIFKHGLIIMLLGIPEGIYFNAAYVKEVSAKSTAAAGEELGEKLLYGFKGLRRDLSMIFSDGLIQDGSGLIWGLQEKLGASFPLVGASASDNLSFQKTYLYFNQEIFSDTACGMLWGGKLNFGLGIKHGWKPLGKLRRVTKAKDNTVYEIDSVAAVKIYEEYFAKDMAGLKKDLKHISVLYPIGIYLPGEEEYLLRNISSIKEDGSLIFQGNVPQDAQIRLMIGTKESCLAATQQAAEEVKKGLSGRPLDFVFVFNSVSRYILLGRQANQELEIIKAQLGADIPIIGIYTYGEQAPLRAISYLGRTYFHNQTVTILGIAG